MSKLRKSKSKKLLKSRNSPNFNITKVELSFLTPNARMAFNQLWLAFIKALILSYFNLKYHIWIETNALGYAICRVLSQLTFEISPNKVVIKTDLGQ